MNIKETILLYSVSTQIAYRINELFYGRHFVWCSPVFNSEKLDSMHVYKKIPPSSNPFRIYERYKQDVNNGDLHSAMISQNKAGLKKGAIIMLKNGVIDNSDFVRINNMVDSATIDQFSPVIYLIPNKELISRIKLVDVAKVANPLSIEYQIEDLKKDEFEIIEP